jgi:hypothetical protein
MAKILKSLQSEGGFSIDEAPIIDPDRNLIDVHSLKVQSNANNKTFKKEYIAHSLLNNTNPSVVMDPGHEVDADRIVFVTGFLLGTWEGYPIVELTSNANSVIVSCTLNGHGLATGDSIDVEFNNATYSSFNGTYTVTVTSSSAFTFETATPLDANNPVLNEILEITSLGDTWEYAVKIESAVLSDGTQTLTTAAHSVTIVKDNVPPGQVWSVSPTVNNVTKEFSFLSSVSTNGTLEKRSGGIRWCAKVEIVYTERSY